MIIAQVLGSVTADQHHPGYDGLPIKMVRPEHGDEDLIAVDRVGAAPGERVLVMREGNGVRQILGGQPPVRSLIIGIVDEVTTA